MNNIYQLTENITFKQNENFIYSSNFNQKLDPKEADVLLLLIQANGDVVSKEKQIYILKLLEDLSITVSGKSVLSTRKKGALRGVVEALREKMIIPNKGIAMLCNLIAVEINLELNSELDASTTSENYKKEALKYINNNPLH